VGLGQRIYVPCPPYFSDGLLSSRLCVQDVGMPSKREGETHKSAHSLSDVLVCQPLGAIAQEKQELRKAASTELSF